MTDGNVGLGLREVLKTCNVDGFETKMLESQHVILYDRIFPIHLDTHEYRIDATQLVILRNAAGTDKSCSSPSAISPMLELLIQPNARIMRNML